MWPTAVIFSLVCSSWVPLLSWYLCGAATFRSYPNPLHHPQATPQSQATLHSLPNLDVSRLQSWQYIPYNVMLLTVGYSILLLFHYRLKTFNAFFFCFTIHRSISLTLSPHMSHVASLSLSAWLSFYPIHFICTLSQPNSLLILFSVFLLLTLSFICFHALSLSLSLSLSHTHTRTHSLTLFPTSFAYSLYDPHP